MAKIPVGDTINYAYSFTFGNLITIVGLTWLPLGLAAALGYGLQEYMWTKFPLLFEVQRDPQQLFAMMSQMVGFYALAILAAFATLFLNAVAAVGVTNHALGLRTGPVYVHFALGSPEWRVFGGFVRYFFASVGICLILGLGIAVSILVGTMINGSNTESPLGWIVAAVLIIVLLCLALLTLVRMGYLVVPSIVAEPGKGGLARSYHLTRGNFWRIVLIVLVAVIPVAIVQGGIQSALLGNSMMSFFTELAQAMQQQGTTPDPNAFNKVYLHWMESMHQVLLPMTLIGWVASIFVNGLVYTGAAYAYRALAGTTGVAPAPAQVTA